MNIGARLSDNSPLATVMPPEFFFRPHLVDVDPLLVAGRLAQRG